MEPTVKYTDICPFKLAKEFWPNVVFYDKQREIIRSVEDSVETYVPAGNKLGKDFVTGFIVLSTFLRCIKSGQTCRIVTTSVAEHHLKVLWGEIGRFLTSSKHPLLFRKGGPLTVNHMEIRRASETLAKNPINYMVGRVSERGEGLAGHHADVTLGVADEASGVAKTSYAMFQGWAKRMLFIGNPNCDGFFKDGCRAGDLVAK